MIPKKFFDVHPLCGRSLETAAEYQRPYTQARPSLTALKRATNKDQRGCCAIRNVKVAPKARIAGTTPRESLTAKARSRTDTFSNPKTHAKAEAMMSSAAI